MSSIFFRIEVYGVNNYGCPEMDLMGYDNIDKLLSDCWDILKIYAQEKNK